MADNTIDTLELQVKSSSDKAVKSLENLSKTLHALNKSFKAVNSGGMRNYVRDIGKVTASIKGLSGIKFNTKTISGINKEFQKLGEKLTGIDTNKIQKTSDGIEKVARSLSLLNGLNLKDTKINNTLGALKRLAEVDMSNFDSSGISEIITSISGLSDMPEISSSVNRFIASFGKIASAGGKTGQSASGFANLGRQVRKTITNLSGVGEISESLNLFVQSIGQLASAGSKTGQTAGQLKDLANETSEFFNVMKDAPKISQNTIDMTQALAQLASAGGRVNTATNTISQSFSKLSAAGNMAKTVLSGIERVMGFTGRNIVKLGSKISSAFKNITASSHGLKTASFNLGTLLKTAIGFRAIQGVFNLGRSALDGKGILEIGSAVTEVQNVVDVAFGNMASMVNEFANTSIEKFGLSELAAKQYSGVLMSMFKSSGFNVSADMRQQAAEMSLALTGLAGDLASFYNIRAEDAFYKLRAAMAGEIEPLRQLGVNMNIVNLEAYAVSQGIHKSYQEMSLAEQQMLRYNYIMSVTGAQQGDFARTSMNWANQVRILAMNFQQLAATLGQGLIAAILPAVHALNSLMGKLIQVAETFRNFVYTLMGKKVSGSTGGIVNDLAGIGDTSLGLENLGSAGGDAASGMEDATGAAQDLKKALSVLSFDQLNQLADSASAASGAIGGIGGGGGGLDDIQTPTFGGLADALEQFKDPDVTPINEWAKKIREAFLAHDWDKLGLIISDGVNKGLWYLYDALNWNNVGPKITAFTNAFTETFNSLVDGINWTMAGRVLGTGINSIVNTFNQLVGPYGIDFENIGRKLSVGLRGAINEIEWTNLGNALGNGFMVSWRMLDGFITDMSREDGAGINGWEKLGTSVGEALKATLNRIDFNTIANVFSNGFNSIFDFLKGFNASKPFEGLGEKISTALNNAISNINAEEAGQELNTFVQSILDTLLTAAEKTNWEEFGNKIGTFLSQIQWGEIIEKALSILKEILGGIWSGLGKTSAGKFVQAIIVFKLGMRLMPFVNQIVKFFTGSTVMQKLSGAFQSLFNGGLSGVTGAIKGLGTAAKTAATGGFNKLLTAIGSSGAGIGLIAVLPVATSLLAGFIEKLMGGNGKLSEMGAAINDLGGKLQNIGAISSTQADEIYKIVDSCEDTGKSAEEMVNIIMEKFAEWGLSTEQINSVLESTDYWTTKTEGSVLLLADAAGQLGEGMSKTAEEIDLSSVTMKDAMGGMRDALWELSMSGDEFSGTYQGILMSMDDTLSSSKTAQEALDLLAGQLEAAGVPADEFIKKLKEKFPEATKAVKTSVDTHVVGARKTAESNMESMSDTVDSTTTSMKTDTENNLSSMESTVNSKTSTMKSDAEKNLSGVQAAAENSATGSNEATVTSWGNSAREVTLKVREMKLAASKELSNMTETVRSYSQSMYNIMTEKWGYMGTELQSIMTTIKENISGVFDSMFQDISRQAQISVEQVVNSFSTLSGRLESVTRNIGRGVGSEFGNMMRQMVEETNGAVNSISSSFSSIPYNISRNMNNNMFYAGRNAAQSFANGFSSVHIPTPHFRISSWRRHDLGNGGIMHTPQFSVNWYKMGGLFNKASVIGVGEAGTEAVLPLENKRTMSMIADSILSNSSGCAIDEKVLTDAVARGVAMAMMNNQQNPVNVTCYAELKTENDEVLARAVTRGQKKLDYRMNPSPQFG